MAESALKEERRWLAGMRGWPSASSAGLSREQFEELGGLEAEGAGGGGGVVAVEGEGFAGEETFEEGPCWFAGGDGCIEEGAGGGFRSDGIAGSVWGVCGGGGFADAEGDIASGEDVGAGEDGGALEGVFEFADVAWPVVAFHQLEGFLGEAEARVVFFLPDALDEELGERADIVRAFAEGREVDADDVDNAKALKGMYVGRVCVCV
jgi:hypothetical protein